VVGRKRDRFFLLSPEEIIFFRADGDDTPDGTGSNTRLAASSKSSETRHGEIYTTADNLRRQS